MVGYLRVHLFNQLDKLVMDIHHILFEVDQCLIVASEESITCNREPLKMYPRNCLLDFSKSSLLLATMMLMAGMLANPSWVTTAKYNQLHWFKSWWLDSYISRFEAEDAETLMNSLLGVKL